MKGVRLKQTYTTTPCSTAYMPFSATFPNALPAPSPWNEPKEKHTEEKHTVPH